MSKDEGNQFLLNAGVRLKRKSDDFKQVYFYSKIYKTEEMFQSK